MTPTKNRSGRRAARRNRPSPLPSQVRHKTPRPTMDASLLPYSPPDSTGPDWSTLAPCSALGAEVVQLTKTGAWTRGGQGRRNERFWFSSSTFLPAVARRVPQWPVAGRGKPFLSISSNCAASARPRCPCQYRAQAQHVPTRGGHRPGSGMSQVYSHRTVVDAAAAPSTCLTRGALYPRPRNCGRTSTLASHGVRSGRDGRSLATKLAVPTGTSSSNQNECLFRSLLSKKFRHLLVIRWAEGMTKFIEQPFGNGVAPNAAAQSALRFSIADLVPWRSSSSRTLLVADTRRFGRRRFAIRTGGRSCVSSRMPRMAMFSSIRRCSGLMGCETDWMDIGCQLMHRPRGAPSREAGSCSGAERPRLAERGTAASEKRRAEADIRGAPEKAGPVSHCYKPPTALTALSGTSRRGGRPWRI